MLVTLGAVAFHEADPAVLGERSHSVQANLTRQNRTKRGHDANTVGPSALGLPIINVGLPKSASTSVLDFFKCNGLKASHYHCQNDCSKPGTSRKHFCQDEDKRDYCGPCIKSNFKHGAAPFENCGDYDVWAQMDGPWDGPDFACFLPQVTGMDQLHAAYPNATFVLPTRSAENWVRSVTDWQPAEKLRERFGKCNLKACPKDCVDDDEKFAAFYESHTKAIRWWVQTHPSHRLLEFDVEDPDAAAKLAAATGFTDDCWGQANCRASCEFWEEQRFQKEQRGFTCLKWCHDPSRWDANSSWTERCTRADGHCRGCEECAQGGLSRAAGHITEGQTSVSRNDMSLARSPTATQNPTIQIISD